MARKVNDVLCVGGPLHGNWRRARGQRILVRIEHDHLDKYDHEYQLKGLECRPELPEGDNSWIYYLWRGAQKVTGE